MGVTTRSAGESSAELLSWDSEFWGVRIAKAPTLMDDWALDNTIGCMWLLIPAHEQADIHRAEEGGARVMDVRVKLEHTLGVRAVTNTRRAEDKDTEQIVKIARSAFRGLTRFYADPRFPDERCDDLYENWVRDSLSGWAATTIVHPWNGKIGGFITVHLDDDVASIGLIAVAKKAQGNGLGKALTLAAINWADASGAKKLTVVTQGCNIPAQRTFHGSGFAAAQTDIWLHKWLYD
jgi:ribosomal protein S18 acetylase RimI-like enzyme